MRNPRIHLTYANVMATIAVFIALGGGAYAAFKVPKNSVGSKQIKDGQVKSKDVGDGALFAQDFADGQLPAPDTSAQVLDKLKSVDGAGSGVDADSVDGIGSDGLVKPSDSIPGGVLEGSYAAPTLRRKSVGSLDLGPGVAPQSLQFISGTLFQSRASDKFQWDHPGTGIICVAFDTGIPDAAVATISGAAGGFPVLFTERNPSAATCPDSDIQQWAITTYNDAQVLTDEPFYVMFF